MSTSGGRDDGARFIPTIAYHLAIAISEVRDAITAVFNRNPAILSYSMEDQMKDLVLGPLADAIARINATGVSAYPNPHLVIIDGLDECNNPLVQSRILSVIAGAQVADSPVHLRFLIASRPDREIRKMFDLLHDIYVGLNLDESYHPDRDIEVYLRSEFSRIKRTHTLAQDLVDINWPSQEDLESLVEKASGQFIYASTIVKFVNNDSKDPRDRLRTIQNVSPGKRSDGSPFVPLDALYTFILSTAVAEAGGYDSIQHIFQVLLYAFEDGTRMGGPKFEINTPKSIATFFGISHTEVQLSLVDLHSIMFIPRYDSPYRIRFFHASFGDFLKDSSRSSVFVVEEIKAHIALGNRCLDIVLEHKEKANDDNMENVLYYARRNYFMHIERSGFHEEILSHHHQELSHDKTSLVVADSGDNTFNPHLTPLYPSHSHS